MTFFEPLRLTADERSTAWGGNRLTGSPSVGELWVAHGGSVIREGPHKGHTLQELCEAAPGALTGEPSRRSFPLIVKLLDTASWLSVQVHPDDAGAERLDGPGARGKTEAWHIIDAAPGAEMVTGPCGSATEQSLRSAFAHGDPLAGLQRRPIARGDSVLIPARTIHTLSAGVLAYEVQQASNATYRVYDWEHGRELHSERFWETADLDAQASVASPGTSTVIVTQHFEMRVHDGPAAPTLTAGFRVVTALDATATVSGEGWTSRIAPMATVLVPACLGGYTLQTSGRVVVSSPAPAGHR